MTGLALGRLRSPIKAAKGGLASIQSTPVASRPTETQAAFRTTNDILDVRN